MNERYLSEPALETPTLVRYKVLAWMCALSMITYIDRVCISRVQRDMQTDLGISDGQFAWVFAAFGLAYALFEVPSGWLGDRFGPRLVLCRIVLWWSLFTALTGSVWYFTLDSGYVLLPGVLDLPLLLNAFVALLIVRFLFGMGEAGAYPNIARALRNWFPFARRGLAQGLLWTFGRWGGAVAPLLIMFFAGHFGWRGAFYVFGLMGVVWVVGFWFWYRDTPRQHPAVNDAERALIEQDLGDSGKPAPLSWRTMLRSPTLWLLCGMYFFSNCGWCFFITWHVRYYEKELYLAGTALDLAAGAPLFFGGIACLLGGFLTDRQVRVWGRRWGRTLQGFLAYFFGGTFFLLALVSAHPLLSVAALCTASFLKDFAMAASWSTCIDIGHRYSGTVAGFMNMVGNFGTFVSPPIVAALASAGNWGWALAYSAAMFFLACGCWLFIEPRKVIVYAPKDRLRLQAEGYQV
jgi:MFS family permease